MRVRNRCAETKEPINARSYRAYCRAARRAIRRSGEVDQSRHARRVTPRCRHVAGTRPTSSCFLHPAPRAAELEFRRPARILRRIAAPADISRAIRHVIESLGACIQPRHRKLIQLTLNSKICSAARGSAAFAGPALFRICAPFSSHSNNSYARARQQPCDAVARSS